MCAAHLGRDRELEMLLRAAREHLPNEAYQARHHHGAGRIASTPRLPTWRTCTSSHPTLCFSFSPPRQSYVNRNAGVRGNDAAGDTALHMAVRGNFPTAVLLLLTGGANASLPNTEARGSLVARTPAPGRAGIAAGGAAALQTTWR